MFYDYESEYNSFYYNPLITLAKAVTRNTNITTQVLPTSNGKKKKSNIFFARWISFDITHKISILHSIMVDTHSTFCQL